MNDRRSSFYRWAVGLFIWTAAALFFVAQSRFYFHFEGSANMMEIQQSHDLLRSMLWEFFGWYLWGLFSILIYQLAQRFPLEKGHWIRRLPIHLAAGTVFAFAHMGLHIAFLTLVDRFFHASYEFSTMFVERFSYRLLWRIGVYFVVLTGCHILLLRKRVSDEEQRASQLEVQLAHAQLQALKMQLQPHFLFNTLQSISELMHQDIDAADEMMVRLGLFFRMTLENTTFSDVSLEKELEFLQCYLQIEELRFRDRLVVRMEIDPQTLRARVPNLILQPIVENAIKHGIAPQESGEIQIHAVRNDGILHIEIRDNGAGLHNGPEREHGVGLSNTRARLEQLYGKHQRCELRSLPEGGVLVILDLPFTTESEKDGHN